MVGLPELEGDPAVPPGPRGLPEACPAGRFTDTAGATRVGTPSRYCVPVAPIRVAFRRGRDAAAVGAGPALRACSQPVVRIQPERRSRDVPRGRCQPLHLTSSPSTATLASSYQSTELNPLSSKLSRNLALPSVRLKHRPTSRSDLLLLPTDIKERFAALTPPRRRRRHRTCYAACDAQRPTP
jgi:hypothetical protein